MLGAEDSACSARNAATARSIVTPLDAGEARSTEGSGGQWPGAMWNVHGMSVDQDGNFYIAEVNNGRPQKFRPRAGANKAMLMGQPIRSAWR